MYQTDTNSKTKPWPQSHEKMNTYSALHLLEHMTQMVREQIALNDYTVVNELRYFLNKPFVQQNVELKMYPESHDTEDVPW